MSDMPPPPPSSAGPGPYGGGGGSPAESVDAEGFFKALFDFSFTNFITPKVVKFVYILATVLLVLGWLGFMLASFSQSSGAGLAVLILGPIFVVVYLALIRMTLEFYLAIVRMSEDVHHRLPVR
jgi:hypothetical protein